MKRFYLFLFLLLASLVFSSPVLAADSTSFDPTKVMVQSVGASLPVGTVITWPSNSWPSDRDNWLECNGQSISSAVYPELVALIGSRVPDYRGLFLRGVGGNSAALGLLQEDEIKSHSHKIPRRMILPGEGLKHDSSLEEAGLEPYAVSGESSYTGGNETRPKNRAVRYLIRVR